MTTGLPSAATRGSQAAMTADWTDALERARRIASCQSPLMG
jgi:hypothetical protein